MGKAEQARLSRSQVTQPARCLVQGALLALITVAAGAQARAVVHRTPLEYPALAARMHVFGTVTVVATIDASGNVTEAKAIVGHALLRQAAEKAVQHWKFASAAKPTTTNVDVHFELDAAPAQ